MRFNYQQRVGRAGRRGAPMSMALTLCRGRSHDDYYFQRPERITADPPPAPYVDTSRPQILQRVLAKEVLRRAFAELGLFATTAGDSVHGEFGEAAAWTQAPANQPPDPALIQGALSERLANHGILPMLGFPTRARMLYHKAPRTWPPHDVVDRDLELAVSMFAPGAETVKERTIHTTIGVGHYRRQGPYAAEDSNPLGLSFRIGLCGNCQHVETQTPTTRASVSIVADLMRQTTTSRQKCYSTNLIRRTSWCALRA